MLSREVKKNVSALDPYDNALLIEYLYETINKHEDKDNLELWIKESESRLDGVKKEKLNLIEYSVIKAKIQ